MTTQSSAPTVPDLESTTEIDASPAQVWAALADLPRMREWSDQVVRTKVVGGQPKVGSRMINLNRRGKLFWPTNAKVVRFEPHRDLAFRVTENWTVWSFALEPLDGGARTRVTHKREAPKGISPVSKVMTKAALGGSDVFTGELEAGMAQTLARVKAAVER